MKFIIAAVAAIAVLGLGSASTLANAGEEPAWTLVRSYETFEVRDYAPYLVAEVVVAGPADEAGNQGFRILAGYIFGKNRGERSIAMTAPVTQAPEPARIAMTAPVTQAAEDAGAGAGFVIQFRMPGEYTLATLPEPLDARVKLREFAGGRFAVIRYSGTWSDSNYREHLDLLQRGVDAAGLHATGSPIYSRYNAPFVPWFMRRNEIWLKVN
jgi:hypothetical protein